MPDSLRSRDRLAEIARAFHEAYERLAPSFGYETRKESAVPWEDVPGSNRALMEAVVAEVVAPLVESQAHEIAEAHDRAADLDGQFSWVSQERDDLRQELVRAERRQTVYLDLHAGMREALQEARRDVFLIGREGWDSTRRRLTVQALERIDTVLAGEGGPAAEEDR